MKMFKLKKKEKKNRFGWLKEFLTNVFIDDLDWLFLKFIVGAIFTAVLGLVIWVLIIIVFHFPIILILILLGLFISAIVGHFIVNI
jgi:hypothetical protein